MIKLLLLSLISLNVLTAPKEYLYCLGQEEKSIHLDNYNPARKLLNERIISSLLQLPEDVVFNTKYLNKVCKSKAVSEEILKGILKKENLFKINIPKTNRQLYAIAKKSLDDLHEESFLILLDYISKVKTLNQDPNCFKKFFPGFDKVLNDAVYNLEESGTGNLLKSIGNIDKVFKKMKSYPVGLRKC